MLSKDLADKISEIQGDISYTDACSPNKETYAVTLVRLVRNKALSSIQDTKFNPSTQK